MIFYEAPHRLLAALEDMSAVFGPDRPAALCRELTKLHEETVRTTLAGALDRWRETPPRGEFVLVVAGAPPREEAALTLEEGVALVLRRRGEGLGLKEAVRQVSADTGLPKNQLYDAALRAAR